MRKALILSSLVFVIAITAFGVSTTFAGEHGGQEHGGTEAAGTMEAGQMPGTGSEVATLKEAASALKDTNPQLARELEKLAEKWM